MKFYEIIGSTEFFYDVPVETSKKLIIYGFESYIIPLTSPFSKLATDERKFIIITRHSKIYLSGEIW